MATFLNGKAGLVSELRRQRDTLVGHLQNDAQLIADGKRPLNNKIDRENILGQVSSYTLIMQWLESPDVHLLSESDYANSIGAIAWINSRDLG